MKPTTTIFDELLQSVLSSSFYMYIVTTKEKQNRTREEEKKIGESAHMRTDSSCRRLFIDEQFCRRTRTIILILYLL
jgi:hypothetical protein